MGITSVTTATIMIKAPRSRMMLTVVTTITTVTLLTRMVMTSAATPFIMTMVMSCELVALAMGTVNVVTDLAGPDATGLVTNVMTIYARNAGFLVQLVKPQKLLPTQPLLILDILPSLVDQLIHTLIHIRPQHPLDLP